jgi:serine/threonine-protein kinase
MTDPIGPIRAAVAGRYEIEREIGQGAFATVYLARDLRHDRLVAFKVLNADPTSENSELRFLREIRLLAKLQHPNILPLIDSGHAQAMLYYVMPYVKGESLRERIHRERQLPLDAAIAIAHETADALACAHEQGIIHRDIKPENILLSGGHPMIADFGVARAIDLAGVRQLTRTGVGTPGTPAYMSPEQMLGDSEIDQRTDIYSLGCVLYEMLSGKPPFLGKDGFIKRFTDPPPLPSTVRRNLPPALDTIVTKALSRDPKDRYPTAADFAQSLSAASHIGAVQSRPSHKSVRRGLFTTVGLPLVVLVLASSSWYWYDHKTSAIAAAVADGPASLAVLPFENLGKPDDAYFADGMTEEISSRLGTLSGLKLIGRQSAKSYANTSKSAAQIGKELGVAYLLTGTVRWDRSRSGHNLVKVSPVLQRASDGAQVWAEPYQDEVTGVFEIQGKVAGRVAQALKIQLSQDQQKSLASRPTNSLEAYDYYLRGKALESGTGNPLEFSRAIGNYQRAVALDSGYAEAYASLGSAHVMVYWFRGDPSSRRLEMAKAAIDRALALDPKLAAAQIALANYYYHGKLDYPRALDAIRIAQQLSANDPEAIHLKSLVERRQNRWNDAIRDETRASELDPRNTSFLVNLGYSEMFTRRYEDAQNTGARVIAIEPEKWLGYALLARAAMLRSGDVRQTLAVLEQARMHVGVEQLGAGLISPDTRLIWPAVLNTELARDMDGVPKPAEDAQRLDYFTDKLLLAVYRKNVSAMRQFADSIILYAPRSLHGKFFDSEMHAELSLAYAAKGDKGKTLDEGRRAMAIVPLEADAVRGVANLQLSAAAAVLVGANDQALTLLQELLTIPSLVSPALLRVDPWFDPLRQDPRLKQLVSSP